MVSQDVKEHPQPVGTAVMRAAVFIARPRPPAVGEGCGLSLTECSLPFLESTVS